MATAWETRSGRTGRWTSGRSALSAFQRAMADSRLREKDASVKARVLAMVRAAGGGRTRIADVYDRFGEEGRIALRALKRERKVGLFPIDNRREVTDRDVRAAIDGDHVIYAL